MTDKEIYERQEDVISNLNIFGLADSMWASGYPMSTEIRDIDDPSIALDVYCFCGYDDKMYSNSGQGHAYAENCIDEFPAELLRNTVARVKRLGKAPLGSGHDNYLNGCVAQFDLTFTVKAWTEAERYHFFDFVSSQSTMHRLQKMDISKSCIKYVDGRVTDVVEELVRKYNENPTLENRLKMLYSCPTGLKLTARMTTNYRQLKTIYHQRKNHTLPEWRRFCQQLVDEFPMFRELCLVDDE